ncbi:unnamed protein product [Sphagnum tenellum]
MGSRWPHRVTRPPRPNLNGPFSQLPHAPVNFTRANTRNTHASTHQRTTNETREERTRSWLARPPPQARAIAEDINRRRERREELNRLRHRTQSITFNENKRSRSPRRIHHRYEQANRGSAAERYFSSPTFARRPANQQLPQIRGAPMPVHHTHHDRITHVHYQETRERRDRQAHRSVPTSIRLPRNASPRRRRTRSRSPRRSYQPSATAPRRISAFQALRRWSTRKAAP